ncbi:hypothetical protein MAR_013835 [Mya arenaria]|uniref:Uncharacterized protein n=1 Tax=Mya arenaria TaxID=6604 RepID=A0ABY7G408_MYAAR|nr:hypothetical protein MAR_013823 [Mya arenaria]WAR28131.1 hypothetical protein MAR_013835 [Mya arenaria]
MFTVGTGNRREMVARRRKADSGFGHQKLGAANPSNSRDKNMIAHQEQQTCRESQATKYGKYRRSDLPDIQIDIPTSLLSPTAGSSTCEGLVISNGSNRYFCTFEQPFMSFKV